MKNQKILWITRTGVLIALLVLAQYIGKLAGANQIITGSLVNLVLLVSVGVAGMSSGMTVAVLSPVFAQLIGVGPAFIALVPAVMLGNLVLVTVFHFVFKLLFKNEKGKYIAYIAAVVSSAILKYAFLALSVSYIIVPNFVATVKPKAAATIITMFSYPQLITALIGGAIAVIIIPVVKKAIKE